MARADEKPGPVVRVMTAVTAAAKRITTDSKGKTKDKPPREDWQSDAWDVFDEVPEVGQAVTFIANVVGGVRLFIALKPMDLEDEPMPAPAGTVGAFEADEVLRRLDTGSTHGGLSGLLTASIENLKVPGEYYLLGEEPKPGDPTAKTPEEQAARPEQWSVKSVSEVKVGDAGVAEVSDRPGGKGRKVRFGLSAPQQEQNGALNNDETVFLLRVWKRHPRYGALARSSLRAALNECMLLLKLTRAIDRTANSRLAGAGGVVVMASELDESPPPAEGDDVNEPTITPFMKALASSMMEPVEDDTSPHGVIPPVVQGPHAMVKDGFQFVPFGAKFDPEIRAIRKELLERLDAVLDVPLGTTTHQSGDRTTWRGTFLIDAQAWGRYAQPDTRLICDSWTEGLLWPMLEESGIAPEAARKLMIWFDASDAVLDPDESKTADELFDRAAISWEALRRKKGASEDDAPDDAELDRRAELGLLRSTMSSAGGEMGPANTAALPPGDWVQPHRSITAAQRPSLARRLMEIDRDLRGRLEEAAESTIHRALSRAGARVRSRAQRDDNLAATLRDLPAHIVTQRVGQTVTAALELSESDLLIDGVEDMGGRFDQRTAAAQRQARRLLAAEFDLTDAELDAMEQRQDRDRAEAWIWLSGALLALARSRLFDPAPAVTQGEGVSGSVPTSLIREAMSRAGGGALGEGLPLGGVALGQLVLETFAQHGQVVGGWEWVYGDPTNPFPGHENLDGVQFASWDDPVLLVAPEDAWLGELYYRPADHDGCQCTFAPLMIDAAAPTDDERVSELMDALG